jgi:hypothetical protein
MADDKPSGQRSRPYDGKRQKMTDSMQTWRRKDLLERSFEEYIQCVRDVLRIADELLQTPPGTPGCFAVKMGQIPPQTWSIGRNLFSTLFQSTYHLLDIHPERRLLYGKLNHLFRIWVTSADNLLDNEDKVVVPIAMGGSSRVMRQVVSIMIADRVMDCLTSEAVGRGLLLPEQAGLMRNKSLQGFLPSAAEEAAEEGGIVDRPDPEYVLFTIHRLKTGMLFHVPFLGPEHIEQGLDMTVLDLCKEGLMSFGLGCQILDDVRDLAKDVIESRHNYVLSQLYAEQPVYVDKLRRIRPDIDQDSNIHELFPDVVHPAAERAMGLLSGGLLSLGRAGLGIDKASATAMSLGMFETLGVGELARCVSH